MKARLLNGNVHSERTTTVLPRRFRSQYDLWLDAL